CCVNTAPHDTFVAQRLGVSLFLVIFILATTNYDKKYRTAWPGDDVINLTPQETACLKWAAAGKTSNETGLILHISKRTVDYHIHNACHKLGVHSRQAAVVVAVEIGLFPDLRALLPQLPV